MKLNITIFLLSTFFFGQIVTQSALGELLGGPIGDIAIDAAEGLLGQIKGLIFGGPEDKLNEIIELLNQVQDKLNEIEDKENEILDEINVLNLDVQKRLIGEKLANPLSIIDGLFDDHFAYLHAIRDGLYRQNLTKHGNEVDLLSESIRRDIHPAIERINAGVFDYLNTLLSDLTAKKSKVFEVQLAIRYSIKKIHQAYTKARILLSFALRTCRYLEGAINNTSLFQLNLNAWFQNNFKTSWSSAFWKIQDGFEFAVDPWTSFRSKRYTACLQYIDKDSNVLNWAIVTTKSSCSSYGSVVLKRAANFHPIKNPAIRIFFNGTNNRSGYLAWDKNNVYSNLTDTECESNTKCDWYPFYAQNTVYSDLSDQLNYVYFGYKDSVDAGTLEVLDVRDDPVNHATVQPFSNSSDTQLFTISPQPSLILMEIPDKYYFLRFHDALYIRLSNEKTSPLLQLDNQVPSTAKINASAPYRWLVHQTSKNMFLIINRYTNDALSSRNGQLYLTPLLAKKSNSYNNTVGTDLIVQEWAFTGAKGASSLWSNVFGSSIYLTLSQADSLNWGRNNSVTMPSDRNGTVHLNSAFLSSSKLSLQATKPKSCAQRFIFSSGDAGYDLSSDPTNSDINYTIDPWNNGTYSLSNTALMNGTISTTRRVNYDSKFLWQFKQRPQGSNVFWITANNGTVCLTISGAYVSLSSCSTTNNNQLWIVNPEASYDSLAYTIKSSNTPAKSLIYDNFANIKIASNASPPENLFRILSITR